MPHRDHHHEPDPTGSSAPTTGRRSRWARRLGATVALTLAASGAAAGLGAAPANAATPTYNVFEPYPRTYAPCFYNGYTYPHGSLLIVDRVMWQCYDGGWYAVRNAPWL